jgi:hypothetical protein
MNSSTGTTCFISITILASSATWVINRWYWSVENSFEFEGKLASKPAATVSTE